MRFKLLISKLIHENKSILNEVKNTEINSVIEESDFYNFLKILFIDKNIQFFLKKVKNSFSEKNKELFNCNVKIRSNKIFIKNFLNSIDLQYIDWENKSDLEKIIKFIYCKLLLEIDLEEKEKLLKKNLNFENEKLLISEKENIKNEHFNENNIKKPFIYTVIPPRKNLHGKEKNNFKFFNIENPIFSSISFDQSDKRKEFLRRRNVPTLALEEYAKMVTVASTSTKESIVDESSEYIPDMEDSNDHKCGNIYRMG